MPKKPNGWSYSAGQRPSQSATERGVYVLPNLHGGGQRYVLVNAGGEIVAELAVYASELHDELLEALWDVHDRMRPDLRSI